MTKKILSLVFAFALFICSNSFAQSSTETKQDGVYTKAEVMPEYPGGAMALYEFFKANLKYPDKAREKGTEGVVVTSFVVDAEGNLKDINVIKNLDPQMDAEAKRVVEMMPRWKPGMQGGKNVPVQLVQPVRFSLTVADDKSKKKK
jgi:TonB family protein